MTDNQLRSWNHIGLFTANIGDADRYQRLANVADTGATLANRARSYLAVNCAMCHNDNGATPVNIDLRFGIPTDSMNTHNVAAISGGLRLVPNSKENSVLWQRMGLLDVMRMPPLGSNVVDPVGRDVIGTWIDAGG